MKIFLLGRFPAAFADIERELVRLECDISHKHYGRNVDLVIVGAETPNKNKTLDLVVEDERRGGVRVIRYTPSTFWRDFEQKMNVRVSGERPCPPPFQEEADEPCEIFEGRRLLRRLDKRKENYSLRGATIMMAGKLKIFKTHKHARDFVASMGGEANPHNVTKNLTYFVVGQNPPPKATERARHLGVTVLGETAFLRTVELRHRRRRSRPSLQTVPPGGHDHDDDDDDDDVVVMTTKEAATTAAAPPVEAATTAAAPVEAATTVAAPVEAAATTAREQQAFALYLVESLRAQSLDALGREIPPAVDPVSYVGQCTTVFQNWAWVAAGYQVVVEDEEPTTEDFLEAAVSEQVVESAASEEVAETTALEEVAETTAPGEVAETTAPEEVAETTAPEEVVESAALEEVIKHLTSTS